MGGYGEIMGRYWEMWGDMAGCGEMRLELGADRDAHRAVPGALPRLLGLGLGLGLGIRLGIGIRLG